MNEIEFFKKYQRAPVVLSEVKQGQTYGLIHHSLPKNYVEVIADNNGTALYTDSLIVRNGSNMIELFPKADDTTISADNQTLHPLHLCTFKTPPKGAVMSERGDADCAFQMCNGVKRASILKAGSRKKRKGDRRLTSRKSKSKTRSVRRKATPKTEIELCPICLEELAPGQHIPKLKCKHRFHKACIEPICRQKGNVGVHCPLCRGDISFSCAADITRVSPWKYDPYTDSTPFDMIELNNMTLAERRLVHKEIQKHRNNYLARRRKTLRNETPEQRSMRIENESTSDTRMPHSPH